MSASESVRYLGFTLGVERYALPLLAVREVIAVPEITPLPQSPSYFLGIINLRGQIISVVDLRAKLGVKPASGSETAVIICDLAPICLGVVVDSIDTVLAPAPGQISEKPDLHGGRGNAGEYITGVYRHDDRLIVLLDVAKTLNADDQKTIGAAHRPRASAAA